MKGVKIRTKFPAIEGPIMQMQEQVNTLLLDADAEGNELKNAFQDSKSSL